MGMAITNRSLLYQGAFYKAVIATVSLLCFLTVFSNFSNNDYVKYYPSRFFIKQISGKDFAYYTQTEECIPELLLHDFALGNSTLLDVYVLSYKKKCQNTSIKHVYYLYDSKTTWTTGRNKLWRYVRDLQIPYKYHIFMDDDARLINTDDIHDYEKKFGKNLSSGGDVEEFFRREDGLKALSKQSPLRSAWRLHENTLLEYSPAFSTVNVCEYTGKQTYNIQLNAWSKVCGNSTMPPVTVTIFFDAIVMAFHHKALPILFPMYERGDQFSWWVSDNVQIEIARRILRGQGISNWKVSVFNTQHRKYPRGQVPFDPVEDFVKTDGKIFAGLSDPYHGQTLSLEERFYGRSNCGKPIKFPVEEHFNINDV